VKELTPSESNRQAHYRHHRKIMDAAFEAESKDSIWRHIGQESVLLYGNKSIHFVQHGNQQNRQEIELTELSHSIEIPRLAVLDPHGLDENVLRLKLEGCIQ